MAYEAVTRKWRAAKSNAQNAGLQLKVEDNFSAKFESLVKASQKYYAIKDKAREPASAKAKEVKAVLAKYTKMVEREQRRKGLTPAEITALKELSTAL
jgi:xylose isomerase